MAVAVAAVAIVYAVAATGRAYVLSQIEGVGSNLVYAYYEAGGNVSESESDHVNASDLAAVRERLGNLASAVSGVTSAWDWVTAGGRALQVRILGSDPSYRTVRNLVVHDGRFLDAADIEARAKVALVTPELAARLYGQGSRALGQHVKAHGIDFSVVGVFSEGVETFGQSEVSEHSILIPYTVLGYLQPVDRVDPLYVSVRSQDRVGQVARIVRETLESRHRAGSLYRVETMEGVLAAARRIMAAMTAAMALVASLTLAVSGVFIMNMMLISVSERVVEIGVRRAIGATRRDIGRQFVIEAAVTAAIGGVLGAVLGIGVPVLAAHLWPSLPVHVPYGWTAGTVAFAIAVGVCAGLLPAARAAALAPAEALRHE